MKIGSIESKPVATPAERKAQPAPVDPKAEPSTKVELSSTAAQLSGVGTEASFDTAKVDRISQAIRDGKFKINPEAIADKLIVNAQELLGRKPS
jgi:negative regulator of flagellin synthesis FlgM